MRGRKRLQKACCDDTGPGRPWQAGLAMAWPGQELQVLTWAKPFPSCLSHGRDAAFNSTKYMHSPQLLLNQDTTGGCKVATPLETIYSPSRQRGRPSCLCSHHKGAAPPPFKFQLGGGGDCFWPTV